MWTFRHLFYRRVRISHKKLLWASSCPLSVGLSAERLPLDGYPWNLILGTFMDICWENPHLIKIGQNCLALYIERWIRFIVDGDTNSPQMYCCETLNFFHCWQWQAAHRYTKHVSGQTNMAQSYVIRAVRVLCWFLSTKYSHISLLSIPVSFYLWRYVLVNNLLRDLWK